MAAVTTIKVHQRTRDRLRALADDQLRTADDVVNAALDELERRRRREEMRNRSLELLDDPEEQAALARLRADTEHLGAW